MTCVFLPPSRFGFLLGNKVHVLLRLRLNASGPSKLCHFFLRTPPRRIPETCASHAKLWHEHVPCCCSPSCAFWKVLRMLSWQLRGSSARTTRDEQLASVSCFGEASFFALGPSIHRGAELPHPARSLLPQQVVKELRHSQGKLPCTRAQQINCQYRFQIAPSSDTCCQVTRLTLAAKWDCPTLNQSLSYVLQMKKGAI